MGEKMKDSDWTHRLELRVPSDKIFFHYKITFNPNLEVQSSSIDIEHVESMFKMYLGIPQNKINFRNKKFEKNGILIRETNSEAETENKSRLVFDIDFIVPDETVKVQENENNFTIDILSRVKIQEKCENQ